MNIRKSIILLSTCAIISSSLSGCYFLPQEEELLDAPVVKVSSAKYSTITAKKKDIVKKLSATGNVLSEDVSEEFFEKASGNLKAIYVHPGEKVKKGQLIAELETNDLDEKIKLQELYTKKAELNFKIAQENGSTASEIEKANVELQIQQNLLDQLNTEAEGAKLYASKAGVVSFTESISSGDWVNTYKTLVRIIDEKNVYVKISPENLADYRVGMKAVITYKGYDYNAEVTKTPVEAKEDGDEDVSSITIKFTDDMPDYSAVGNICDTKIILQESKNTIVVQNTLIKSLNDVKYVYLLKDGQKVQQEVTIGLQTGTQSEILSGVNEGDIIIIR